tara:strand:- start:229 stop:969 length:741 start_codon:yes stop_codon:yes gene_type:complete
MNVLICGCVKNCEKYLDNVINNIKVIQTILDKSKIILSYDNSDDNTLNKLKEHDIQILINKDELFEDRTKNIEKARNTLLDEIYKEHNKEYNYFIMMDMDDACSQNINIKVLDKHLKKNDWNALSFYNKNYYDYWALSIGEYKQSVWKEKEPYKEIWKMKRFMEMKLKKNNIIKVHSAFNGFAIHKKDIFKDKKYKTELEDGYLDCEHKLFYKDIDKIMLTKDYLFDEYNGEHNVKEIMDTISKLK